MSTIRFGKRHDSSDLVFLLLQFGSENPVSLEHLIYLGPQVLLDGSRTETFQETFHVVERLRGLGLVIELFDVRFSGSDE